MPMIKRLLGVSLRARPGMIGMWDSELKWSPSLSMGSTAQKDGIKAGRTRKQMQIQAWLFFNGFLIAASVV